MPTPLQQLPADATSLARRVAALDAQLRELRAARRIAATVDLTPWQDLPLANEWTPANGWQTPQFRQQIDGAVQCRGSATPGTLTDGTVLAILPPAYAPPAQLEFRVGGGTATAAADLYVAADGTITIQAMTGTISRISLTTVRIPL